MLKRIWESGYSLTAEFLGALAGSIAWTALALVGLVIVYVSKSPDWKFPELEVLGQLAIVFGSAGIGARIGRDRADVLTEARLIPPFKSAIRGGLGIVRLRDEVAFARQDIATRGTPSIPVKDAEAHLRAVAIRIDEQGSDRLAILDDWRPLLPGKVAELEGVEESETR